MRLEPRQREDYSDRQIEAARRVLVDLGQVLRSFEDCLVVVGGWVPDLFLIMKAYALANRDKPKDAYDLCFCLDHYPGGLKELAANWKRRAASRDVLKAIGILKEKFAAVDAYGPGQVMEFYNSANTEEQERQARRAFELVQEFLKQIG